MIEQNHPLDQLSKEIKPAFQEQKIIKHLHGAGFKKSLDLLVLPYFGLCSFCCSIRKIGFAFWRATKVNHSLAKIPYHQPFS
jgi:hypothetical protein